MGVSTEMVGCAIQVLCRRSWGIRVPSHVQTQVAAQTLAEGLYKKIGYRSASRERNQESEERKGEIPELSLESRQKLKAEIKEKRIGSTTA